MISIQHKTKVSKEQEFFDEAVNEWVKETKIPRYIHIKKHVLKLFNKLDLRGKYVLELGCGASPFLSHLKQSHNYGLDLSKKLLDMNNQRVAKFVHGDILKCSRYFNREFDLIFIVGAVHHIDRRDHWLMLGEIKKILKKDGLLLIVEPNMVSMSCVYYLMKRIVEKLLSRKILSKIHFYSEDEKHVTPFRFKKHLRKAGFSVKCHSIQLLRLPPVGFLRKINIEPINYWLDKLRLPFGTMAIYLSKLVKKA